MKKPIILKIILISLAIAIDLITKELLFNVDKTLIPGFISSRDVGGITWGNATAKQFIQDTYKTSAITYFLTNNTIDYSDPDFYDYIDSTYPDVFED